LQIKNGMLPVEASSKAGAWQEKVFQLGNPSEENWNVVIKHTRLRAKIGSPGSQAPNPL
jgi:hypothetical protein